MGDAVPLNRFAEIEGRVYMAASGRISQTDIGPGKTYTFHYEDENIGLIFEWTGVTPDFDLENDKWSINLALDDANEVWPIEEI